MTYFYYTLPLYLYMMFRISSVVRIISFCFSFIVMISVQGKFLCNNVTEGFTFFRYNRDTKFERGTKHWQKEWQVSIKKDVLPAEYVKILVRWQLSKFTMDVMLW